MSTYTDIQTDNSTDRLNASKKTKQIGDRVLNKWYLNKKLNGKYGYIKNPHDYSTM